MSLFEIWSPAVIRTSVLREEIILIIQDNRLFTNLSPQDTPHIFLCWLIVLRRARLPPTTAMADHCRQDNGRRPSSITIHRQSKYPRIYVQRHLSAKTQTIRVQWLESTDRTVVVTFSNVCVSLFFRFIIIIILIFFCTYLNRIRIVQLNNLWLRVHRLNKSY